jgi:hypothetical protein
MMAWTVTLEAIATNANATVDDIADDLLTALLRDPELTGVVTFTNTTQRTVGATFDVKAPSVEGAVRNGMMSWSRATRQIGLDAEQLLHVEIDREAAEIHV